MKKGLITFCAFVLLATQAPAANAAATTGGVSGESYEKLFNSIQSFKYKSIILKKDSNNWSSFSNFIKIQKATSVKDKVSNKGTEVKESVTKQTEDKATLRNDVKSSKRKIQKATNPALWRRKELELYNW